MKKILLIFIFLSSFYSNLVTAEGKNLIVEQKDKKFIYEKSETQEIKAKVGDTIEFVNSEDKISHNLYSKSTGNSFIFRVQLPKENNKFKINKSGVITVKCAIHPNMKLTIIVK